jgi:hypothetical protein
MRKRENTQLVRINWDDSDVPRDLNSRRYTQVFDMCTHKCLTCVHMSDMCTHKCVKLSRLVPFSSNTIVCSVCIGRTGALQVRDAFVRARMNDVDGSLISWFLVDVPSTLLSLCARAQ